MLVALLCAGFTSAWGTEVTYDFSTGGTFNSGDNPTASWSTDFFTILQEQGESTNKVANYLTAPRWYQNHTVTITPVANCTITQIVINCNSTNNGQTISCSRGEITASGNNSTWVGSITNSYPLVLTMGKQCRPTSLVVTYSIDGPTISASDVTLEYDAEEGEIGYSIANQVDGVTLKATSDASWISNFQVFSNKVTFTTTQNNGDADRIGKIKLTYTGATDKEVTVTQKHFIRDYAELPFSWLGGASNDLLNLAGVTASGLGDDYSANNEPYLVKFDNTGDFIQVKTNGQPGKVSIDVKMIGGANTSSITVQGSSDGETFTPIQELAISGAQNAELTLETTNDFAETDRYVRLLFTKGSNVGVGAISIAMSSSDPVISAENVNIEYNTKSGSIEYEIVHPVVGGVISATSDAEWLTFGETGVAFTATVNEAIDARTADVTLTYTYNSTENVTKVITVTQAGNPNAPGTQNNPYSVAQAIANTPASGTSAKVYIQGIVSAFFADDIVSDGTNYRYYISDNGSTDNQLLVYRGKGLNNVVFSDANDLAIGDEVVIYGGLTTYSEAPEVASGNYIISLNRPEKQKHVVTFSVNGEETTAEVQEGEAIVFPDAPADIYCKTFLGWTDEEINGEQDEAPEMVTSATMGTEDVAFYAVFAKKTPGEVTEITDVLTKATTGVTGTSYSSWSGKTLNSSAVYAGNSAGGNSSIQLRSQNPSSIITTQSGGTLKKVMVEWNSSTANGRTLRLYGKNTAYLQQSDTYDPDEEGEPIGEIICGTSTELTIGGDYKFFCMRSMNGAMYLSSISVIWEGENAATYSAYCTTVPVPEPVTVNMSSAGYSTLYYGDRNLVVPENMEAYTVKVTTKVERSTTYNEGDVIPAGTGVVLKAAQGSYTFNVSATAGDKDNANMLRGSDGKGQTTGGTYYYALTLNAAKDPDSAGFYWMVENGGAYQAGAHKAYLALDNTFAELAGNGTAKGYLALPGDETDGIGQIEFGQTGNAGIYNLNGQKVNKAQKGIYIVNGKKVVIR